MTDYSLSHMAEQILAARNSLKPILIKGGGTKSFYGNPILDDQRDGAVTLDMTTLRGVVSYEPSELVITAMAGTPLSDIKSTLAQSGQALPFDPPEFGAQATLGGCVAAGLSGPSSFAAGPLRHYVLGTQMLDAEGRLLSFGGEVMKNVAGYDIPRLLTGSMGIFGAIVRVSIKVMPMMRHDQTIQFECTQQQALDRCKGLRAQAMPIKSVAWIAHHNTLETAGAFDAQGVLRIRLSGALPAVTHAIQVLGGDTMPDEHAQKWWRDLREQQLDFFKTATLWRVAVRANTPALDLGPTSFDLAGEIRWVAAELDPQQVRDIAQRHGGHATLFKRAHLEQCPADGVFQPMAAGVHQIVKRLKHEFDPCGLFNPSRLVLGL